MALIIFKIALFLVLLSTGGFIVYIIRQKKVIFRYSYRILLAGFIFHTIYLVHQFYIFDAVPVISLRFSLSFLAWCITGVYLLFHIRFGLMVLGSFIAPLAAVLMIISSVIPVLDGAVPSGLKSIWLNTHVLLMFTGNSIFFITFMSALLYLIQERHIKKKTRGTFYHRLPSLETLDSINHYSLIYGFPFVTVGIIIGAVYAQQVTGSFWRWDPKEIWSLITWVSYGILLHERLAVGWRGKRAAIMSIFCFCILLFTFLGGSLWLSDYHNFKTLGGISGR